MRTNITLKTKAMSILLATILLCGFCIALTVKKTQLHNYISGGNDK